MDKIQIKAMIVKQVQVIAAAEKDMAISRWKRAKAFSEIHNMIVWDKSPYNSFKEFIAQEFPDLNPGTVFTWTINYTCMLRLYTWPQIQTMAKQISYTRAVRAQQIWGKKKKAPLVTFIKFSMTVKMNTPKPITVSNPNRISLCLPALYVDKFESILVTHGYIIPKDKNATKHGISDALVKYLDTI